MKANTYQLRLDLKYPPKKKGEHPLTRFKVHLILKGDVLEHIFHGVEMFLWMLDWLILEINGIILNPYNILNSFHGVCIVKRITYLLITLMIVSLVGLKIYLNVMSIIIIM